MTVRGVAAAPASRRRGARAGAAVVLSVTLAACSAVKPYPNDLAKNLHIHTRTDPGSWFADVEVAVGIYQVDDCRLQYQGTVNLDQPSVAVGIPAGRPSYLVFEFASSSLFSGDGRISYDTVLQPAPGYSYDIAVSYLDELYNVEIREIRGAGSARRSIDRSDLSACRGA